MDPALGVVPARHVGGPVTAAGPPSPPTAVRPFTLVDLPGVYRVCLRTGDSGRDATALYRDPDLLAHIYAAPYPAADPGLTFVAHDEEGLLGYVVGTADTYAFEEWLAEHWWPPLRGRYPEALATDPGDGTLDWQRVAHIHQARPVDEPLYERFPAHLHIDILPRGQRTGLGRRLMTTLLTALRGRGVSGVHLGVGSGNPRAHAFYLAVGFTETSRDDWGAVMVMDLTQ
ncbi:GNAT family N-acetyltransferase [Actinacidiphila soli]|uniref:GNAT family N-acetyltransferase n=1 Tax=Actinacidiphila soli TaxID=2487275 RepID=UPI0019D04BC5|nr:GNAT family N-acetyltransferase [Actinacidiphila soli]